MSEKVSQPLKILKIGVKEKLLTALAKGATHRIACGFAGINITTFRRWLRHGEALLDMFEEEIEKHPHKDYFDLYIDVQRVEAYAALKWLDKIDEAAVFHWQAAAWKLERRFPNEYGKVSFEVQQSGDDTSLLKAKEEVDKLKSDDHGRSDTVEG
jgi:transposase